MEDLLNDQISIRTVYLTIGLDQFLFTDASILVLVEQIKLPSEPGLLLWQFYVICDVVYDYYLEFVLCVEGLQSLESFFEVNLILFLLLADVKKDPRVL